MLNRFSLALACLLLGTPVPALAQMSTGELTADGHSGRLTAELGFYGHTRSVSLGILGSTSTSIAMVVPSVYANVDLVSLSSDVSLQLDFAWRTAALFTDSDPGDSSSYFRSGNSYVGARVAFHGEHFRVRVGAGVTQPWMNAFDGDDEVQLVLLPTVAMTGGWDAWLGVRGFVSVVLRGDVEYRDGIWFVGADTAIAVAIPVEDRIAEDAAIALQLGVFGGVRPVEGLAAGLRFQAALYDSQRSMASAVGFATLAPFVRGEFTPGFIEGRFLINLPENSYSEALGERPWGVYVLGGLDL